MWLFFAEAGIALFLLLFIVWWTLAPVHQRESKQTGNKADPPQQPGDTRPGTRR